MLSIYFRFPRNNGHRETCSRFDPIANDPERTSGPHPSNFRKVPDWSNFQWPLFEVRHRLSLRDGKCCPEIWEIAMKASSRFVAGLAVATFSVAPANAAQPANAAPTSFRSPAAPWIGCSGSAGTFSPTCRNVGNYKTYTECREAGLKVGYRDTEQMWYCTSLGLR
jgi:hypothetical protein